MLQYWSRKKKIAKVKESYYLCCQTLSKGDEIETYKFFMDTI